MWRTDDLRLSCHLVFRIGDIRRPGRRYMTVVNKLRLTAVLSANKSFGKTSWQVKISKMRTSITEGPDTFTRLRVQNILLEERHICKPDDRGYPTEFQIYSFRYGPSSNLEFFLDDFRAADKERAEAQRWCEEVITELHQGSTGHIQALDNWYSNLLTCHFQTDDPEDIVDRTCFLLRRLPPTVPEFCDSQTKGSYKRLGQDYCPDDSDRVWENLRAANFISRNVIRIALRVELAKDHESSWDNPLRNIINTTTLLLKAAIDLSGKRPSKKWFIVKAFLWTSWKRAISLAYHHTMERQLLHGQYSSNTLETLLDGVDILEEVSKWTQPSNEQERPPDYMCMWALNLLKSNHAVIGQDFLNVSMKLSPTRCRVVSTQI
jgi:hypothetical protein